MSEKSATRSDGTGAAGYGSMPMWSFTAPRIRCKQKLSQAVNDNLGLEDTRRRRHVPQTDFWTVFEAADSPIGCRSG